MVQKGQRLTNPLTGEYFEFVELAADSGGTSSKIKALIKAGGFKPVAHKHLFQDETFEVISGRLTYVLNGKTASIGPGEKIILPKEIAHTHYNAEKEDLLVYQTASPALDFEPFLVSLSHLINQGKVPQGQPPFLQLMVWMKELKGTTCVANIPVGVQKLLATLLTPLGKMMGYRAYYS